LSICPSTRYIESLDNYVTSKVDAVRDAKKYQDPNLLADLECQHQFVKSLVRQVSDQRLNLPNPELGIRAIRIQARKLGDREVAIQGPYLFQPVPHELDDSEGGDATDILYTTSTTVEGSNNGVTIGIIFIVFQDGKLDVCLDFQKLEGKWVSPVSSVSNHGFRRIGLPVLHVYESVDLGRNPDRNQLTEHNFPFLSCNPNLPDMVFVGHGFGVHCISIAQWIAQVHKVASGAEGINTTLIRHSDIQLVCSSYSVSERRAHPITGLSYYPDLASMPMLMVLTSKPEVSIFSIIVPSNLLGPLHHTAPPDNKALTTPYENRKQDGWLKHPPSLRIEPETHISLLSMEPYAANSVIYQRTSPLSSNARGKLDPTPENLRELVKLSEGIREPIKLTSSQLQVLSDRITLQEEEQKRQLQLEQELISKFSALQDGGYKPVINRFQRCTERRDELRERVEKVQRIFLLASSPELSYEEKEWFSELDVIRQSLYGTADWDKSSLKSRSRKLERLMKDLQNVRTAMSTGTPEKSVQFAYTSPRPRNWGTDQVHRYVSRLQYLQKSLQTLQQKTQKVLG